MQLSDTNYAIHGTNEPDSIGKDESLGCIRMKREDVEELFAMVPMGTKVQISKGVLPDELMLPGERYPSRTPPDQTNPNKVYHWLN
ncbi:putative L,D-transpeptidase YkuD [compost metagenome]